MINNNETNQFELNVDELLSQIAELIESRPINNQQAYWFLLTLWGYFEVAILATQQGDDSEGGFATQTKPNIITIKNGYPLFDYGSQLKTSAGNDYGSYTTGRLLTTVKAMMDLLIKRGAKQVRFDGLSAAKRYAWLACEKHNIHVIDFTPDNKEKRLQSQLNVMR